MKSNEKDFRGDLKIYRDDCARIQKIAEYYQYKCEDYWEEAESRVVREEYAPLSVMHRGTYCPSLIKDIVISNVKRKKIYKKLTKRTKPGFRYGFDKDNKLILVDQCDKSITDMREYIIYDKGYQLGITYVPNFGVHLVSECYYEDNKLKQYALYLTMPMDGKICVNELIDKEIYTYSEEKLEVEHADFFNWPLPFLTRYKHTFELEDGYLKTFISQEYKGEMLCARCEEDEPIKVNVVRKVY